MLTLLTSPSLQLSFPSEQLPLARQFLCELKRWSGSKGAPILWLCGDAAACAFVEQNGLAKLASPRGQSGESLVSKRLRISLCASLLGYHVLLADPGAVWLQNPWPWLTGPFDIIASPEQRLGEGFGFPLGSDFLYLRSTNASVNLLFRLLERVEHARVHFPREAAALLRSLAGGTRAGLRIETVASKF